MKQEMWCEHVVSHILFDYQHQVKSVSVETVTFNALTDSQYQGNNVCTEQMNKVFIFDMW